jgi:hypothetical protein
VIDLELDPDLFQALGGLVATPTALTSPWHGRDVTLGDDQRSTLARLGLIDTDGALSVELEPTLVALARSTGSSVVAASSAAATLHHVSYAGLRREPVGLTAMSQGDVRLQDPAPTKHLVDVVERFCGRSDVRGVDISIELRLDDAFVLAAIVDAQRRRHLSTEASEGEPITTSEVEAELDRRGPEMFWLVNLVSRVGDSEPAQVANPSGAIERLAGSGLILATADAVALSDASAGLATRFLDLESIVILENYQVDRGAPDTIARVVLCCLQASRSDLLTIERVGDLVVFETVSSETLLGYVERLIGSPDLGAPVPFEATHIVVEGGRAPSWMEPDTSSSAMAGVVSGTEVRLLAELGGWADVESADGWQGWLDRRWLSDLPVPA